VAQKCKNEHIIQTELTKGASRANTNNRTTVKKKTFQTLFAFLFRTQQQQTEHDVSWLFKGPKSLVKCFFPQKILWKVIVGLNNQIFSVKNYSIHCFAHIPESSIRLSSKIILLLMSMSSPHYSIF
jgi:hypothetical protein